MVVRETRAKTEPRHAALGLNDQDVLNMYYYIVLARALDDRMWVLQRAGKAMFVISGPGHEGCQVGAMWPMDKQRDWFVPFYRSVAACLVKGMSAREILLGLFAKAEDPSSGGRQMPGHYGHPRYKIFSTSSRSLSVHSVTPAFLLNLIPPIVWPWRRRGTCKLSGSSLLIEEKTGRTPTGVY